MHKLAAIAAAMVVATSAAHAEVVNISTNYNDNAVTFADAGAPGLLDTGTTLHLAAGTYTLTAVDSSFDGALYTAANRFGTVDANLARGWEWNYWLSVDGAAGVKHGYGEGIPSQGGSYQADAAGAFAAAPGPVTLTLTQASDVTLYWRDDAWADNTGGVSVDVSAVPEPANVALMLAGLGLLGIAARRRRG